MTNEQSDQPGAGDGEADPSPGSGSGSGSGKRARHARTRLFRWRKGGSDSPDGAVAGPLLAGELSPAPAVSAAQPPRRRRWLKGGIIAAGAVLVLALCVAGASWYYVDSHFSSIPRIPGIKGLKKIEKPGGPFNVLIVGSDTRSWCKTQSCWQHFDAGGTVTGQRSDVTIVMRVVPAERKLLMLSIPRDTWVNIANSGGQQNRVNAAFNSGPSQLIATIEQDFHIPINHFVYTTFPGLQNLVNELRGVWLDFPDPVQDVVTGLYVHHTGCQLVLGPEALALVRSRDLQYYKDGQWIYDGLGDLSRIRRQQAFFHSVIDKADSIRNPLQINDFINAAIKNVAVDTGFSTSLMESLAYEFKDLSTSNLTTEVLPTRGAVYDQADILLPVANLDDAMIKQFLAFGSTPKSSSPTTTTSPNGASSTSPTSSTSTSTTTSTTTTTTTSLPVTGTTTAPIIDSSKYYPEPWNPYPCSP